MGDGVMALFGAPPPLPSSSLAGVRCALDILDALADLEGPDGQPVQVGIGVHTAEVAVGNLGTSTYKNYTAIGAGANAAARIESATRQAGLTLLSSQRVAKELDGAQEVVEVGAFELKGIEEPMRLFTCPQGGLS